MTVVIILVLIGIFLWLANLHIINLARDWPVILIIVGLGSIFHVSSKNKKKKIIEALEKGKITVEEAEERLKKTG
ncbi:MAG TPA: hypothetical protein ENI34_06495 [candidate division WOR-3 bacterium]|uniref:DUF5668 domain-containing protein n=1 Tax=candidate division WOR-3 bacterium TaxID=2052148 RepID=A0A9C9K0D6_UNCW3|nr:hypothetical protein [candidate division WOR-3 bacterium]